MYREENKYEYTEIYQFLEYFYGDINLFLAGHDSDAIADKRLKNDDT
ncbi:hypothetical protein NIES3974_20960 [Calothrix sp. NIES-3974]|nr:hypothetical protein NIES3974_20960 [Calothrix sp. NIES-3974]